MIRILFGSALPVLGLSVAATFFGPNLLAAPAGEPLIVAAPKEAALQPATFNRTACTSPLFFADAADQGDLARTRIVAFALRWGDDDVAVAIEGFPAGSNAAKTIVLVFDDEGDLIAAGDPATLQVPLGNETAADCPPEMAAPI